MAGAGLFVDLEVQISWQVQDSVDVEVQSWWQVQDFVDLEVQMSWQVQDFVDVEVQSWWQVQDFVGLGVQISWQAQDFLWTLKCRFRGRCNTLWPLECRFRGRRRTFVDLEVQISWQMQDFVDVEVQSWCQVQDFVTRILSGPSNWSIKQREPGEGTGCFHRAWNNSVHRTLFKILPGHPCARGVRAPRRCAVRRGHPVRHAASRLAPGRASCRRTVFGSAPWPKKSSSPP